MPTKKKADFVLRQLFAAYPNTQVSDGTVLIYLKLLQDVPVDDLQVVVDQCIASCKFLPTVAELREQWKNLTANLNQISGEEAWGLVTLEFRRTGYVGIPQFEDERTARVVQIMGWQNLCKSEEQMADRAHFMRIYNSLAQREGRIDKLLPEARTFAEHRGLLPVLDTVRALSYTKGGSNAKF